MSMNPFEKLLEPDETKQYIFEMHLVCGGLSVKSSARVVICVGLKSSARVVI